ncbi:MAG TPA: hypothetical protein VHQ03_03210 [Candidatus Dormibacteraeota bacterium]|nr:hypothetical protein [Candidatus Dormibacteraeota bacterium]
MLNIQARLIQARLAAHQVEPPVDLIGEGGNNIGQEITQRQGRIAWQRPHVGQGLADRALEFEPAVDSP